MISNLMVYLDNEPQTEFARKWFEPLLLAGTTACAENIRTTLRFIHTPDGDIPIAVTDEQYANSWVCSPWGQYFGYAKEEILRHDNSKLSATVAAIISLVGNLAKQWQFNKAVIVNAWFLSTAPFPRLRRGIPTSILRFLQREYPDHAIIFRGLNYVESGPILDELKTLTIRMPSRQVWLYAANDNRSLKSRDYNKDVRLLDVGDLSIVKSCDLLVSDMPRILDLYNQLYISKYSSFNPQYTLSWVAHLWEQGLLDLTVLRDSEILAVEGSVILHGILTSPIIGYDLTVPKELGLYRRVACIPIIKCHRLDLPLNLSAGVGRFKRLRGGRSYMEYNAVCVAHLPIQRKQLWHALYVCAQLLFVHIRKHGL